MRKFLIKIYQTDSKTCINSVMEILTNLVSCGGKVFIHINARIPVKDAMKHHYP